MDHLKHSWPALGMKCPFCSHVKCRSCPEVSVNVLACCVCRGRAVRRLAHLEEIYRLGKANQMQAAVELPDGDQLAADPAMGRSPT